MLVYHGSKKEFIDAVVNGTIADTIHEKLLEAGIPDGESQYDSYQNSMPYMQMVLNDSTIDDDVDIAIEYQIPLTSRRVDFIVAGSNDSNENNLVIIELKQWQHVVKTEKNNIIELETYTGGAVREVVHPCQQAYSYAKLIANFNGDIRDKNIGLYPCAYLHNYHSALRSDLTGPQYDEMIEESPLFLKQDTVKLRDHIKSHVRHKSTLDLFDIINNGKLKPSKALQDAVGSVLNGNEEFTLVMEQEVAFQNIMAIATQLALRPQEKHVVVVKGGPGTGKSVIAVNLLAKLIESNYSALYTTKNGAPRYAFSKSMIKGQYSLDFLRGLFVGSGFFYDKKTNCLDFVLADEAHRLKLKSGYHSNLGENQIKEIINAARVSVFFLDEDQVVTTQDKGSFEEIRKWVDFFRKQGQKINLHYGKNLELVSQFRCGGSDGYMAFLDDLLMIRSTANKVFDIDYDIRVFDSPSEMREALRPLNNNNKARMIAGYCYEWVTKDKTYIEDLYDINIGDFHAKWNFDTNKFAVDKNSFEQVGCIHSTQGLEFDYVGIIIGKDLVFDHGIVLTNKEAVAKSDGSSGVRRCNDIVLCNRIIRNTYRTLLSRGQKGCFVYCEDEKLREYLKERIKLCKEYHKKLVEL